MKIAVFSDQVDIRTIRAFQAILEHHSIVWFTQRFFFEGQDGNITCACVDYPNRELRSRGKLVKGACEAIKLCTPLYPHYFLSKAADYPVYDHRLLADIDVCVPFGDFEIYSVLKAREKNGYGYRVVIRDAETIPFLYKKKLDMRFVWPYINKEADLFLSWSERIRNKQLVEGVPPAKTRVLYAGVDTSRYAPGPKAASLEQRYDLAGKRVIVSLGKIESNKGVEFALEADRLLKKRGWDFRHLYIGTGKQFEHFRRLAGKTGVSDVSVFTGFVSGSEVVDHLNLADAFVHASVTTRGWQEQFGMAIVEAMSCCRPVIATYCGSIPDVTGDCALLVNEERPAEIAGAVECVFRNPEFAEQLGARARERVLEKYDMPVVAGRFEDMLMELAGGQ